MSNLSDIKFGLLSEHEINWLKNSLSREINKRAEKPKEYIDVIFADDGSEGFYCPEERFGEIPSVALHRQIMTTLGHGSSITFSSEKIEKIEYQTNCAQYEWNFNDGSNTPVLEDDENEED